MISMGWETREILLVVKTYPERSQKYGNTVCTAGILVLNHHILFFT